MAEDGRGVGRSLGVVGQPGVVDVVAVGQQREHPGVHRRGAMGWHRLLHREAGDAAVPARRVPDADAPARRQKVGRLMRIG